MKYHKIKDKTPNEKPMIPMCWKCANKIVEEIENGVTQLVGCTKCKKITCYKDAEKYCPCIAKMSSPD